MTSYETHAGTIARMERDAEHFLGAGSPVEAQRILADLALLQFEAVTSREWLKLDQARNKACGRISDQIERVTA